MCIACGARARAAICCCGVGMVLVMGIYGRASVVPAGFD